MKIKKGIRNGLIAAIAVLGIGLSGSARNPDFNVGRNLEILLNVFRDLNYFYVDSVDVDKLLKDGAEGMTSGFDPYTEFLPEEDMEQFEAMARGKYGGIGSLIRQKGDWVHIAEPYEGSPADRAGLRIGDRILEINGEDAEKLGSSKVSSKLKGDPGTTVRVKVERVASGAHETVEIKRERIVISGVPYHGFVADSIGYIYHSDFSDDCSSDLRNAFMEMKKSGNLKALILDYRDNGGGILQEAVKILSMFVPKGTEVVSMRGRLKEATAVFNTETEPLDKDIPIVVLTNSGAASAAEIVSGAFQDLDRAVLIGQRTFGKGLVQSTRPVGYNTYLKITTAKYYIPSGRCIQAIDYAHRNEDGSVYSVPDSLVGEFTTRNGRKVYDGGGVMPDVKLPAERLSRFTVVAYSKGYIEDFADLYVKKYPEPVDPATFSLSDEDYAWFVEFMADKDMEFQSETAAALKTLKEKAERELYADDIKDYIAQIDNSLRDDKVGNLELYREQLGRLIEENIVLRGNYRKGVILYNLRDDKEVAAAIGLLNSPERYNAIITSQNTERK